MEDIITPPSENTEYTSKMLCPSKHYAFTYNPQQQWEDRADRIQKIVSSTKRHLDKYSFIYFLNWELSNPVRVCDTSRIHFHGYIYWTSYENLVRWYQEQRNELGKHGMFMIKEIDNYETWENYIWKDNPTIDKFSAILGINSHIKSYNYEPPMHRRTNKLSAKDKPKPSKPTKKA